MLCSLCVHAPPGMQSRSTLHKYRPGMDRLLATAPHRIAIPPFEATRVSIRLPRRPTNRRRRIRSTLHESRSGMHRLLRTPPLSIAIMPFHVALITLIFFWAHRRPTSQRRLMGIPPIRVTIISWLMNFVRARLRVPCLQTSRYQCQINPMLRVALLQFSLQSRQDRRQMHCRPTVHRQGVAILQVNVALIICTILCVRARQGIHGWSKRHESRPGCLVGRQIGAGTSGRRFTSLDPGYIIC